MTEGPTGWAGVMLSHAGHMTEGPTGWAWDYVVTCMSHDVSVITYSRGMSMSEAAYLINEKRPFACPNVGFIKQLRTYEQEKMKKTDDQNKQAETE